MRTRYLTSVAVLLFAIAAAPAAAQDDRRVGITMGYPAAVGLLWRATDTVALRPEFTVAGTSSHSSGSSFVSDVHGWTAGFGISALFYTHRYDHLRTYISPRFVYSRTSSTSENSGVTVSKTTISGNDVGGSGSFGAEYTMSDRFRVFGEVGFAVDHRTLRLPTNVPQTTGNNWNTRGAVGVIVYP